MSNLHKSKQYDLIDMFNDTSRYLDDIFTIDNPEFEKHIPDIYPTELQLNKAITSDKETSFLDLNIKVVGSDVHISVYDKRDDFGFPIVNFPWFSGDVPRLTSFENHSESSSGHALTFYLNLVKYRYFLEFVSEEISPPVFYGDLVFKLRRVKCEANFVWSGSKIVKRLRRRKYDPEIIERTIGFVLGPPTALYRLFLKHCTLTNKAVGTIWRTL